MDFCTPHFGKPLLELNYQDIERFFLIDRTENDQLEFKSSATNFEGQYVKIINSICGFLNSKGGLLIWGAPVGTKNTTSGDTMFVGPLTPITSRLVKDQIISKCSDKITPLPQQIRVNVIQNGTTGCVCVFEIDESNYSPHQTSGTYFMRIDGQTKVAPHHYIEALFRKVKFPNLESYLKITSAVFSSYAPIPSLGEVAIISFDLHFFNWSPYQNDEHFSFKIMSDGFFPASQNTLTLRNRGYADGGRMYWENPYQEVFRFGEDEVYSSVLIFNPIKLENKGNIVISFGGKLSPTKFSKYKLDLSKLFDRHIEKELRKDPNLIICYKNENELAKDGQDKRGLTKESILKNLLG